MDEAHIETEEIIKEIEERLNILYSEAIEELEIKITDYMKRFEKKDETWRAWVEDVKDSDPKEYKKRLSDYQKWREQQMLVGKRWRDMKQTLAEDLQNTNESAKAIAAGKAPDVYALNHNYGTYEVEIGSGLNTNYTLYDRNVVARILKDNPELLPSLGKKVTSVIARGEAIRWNKQQIQSVATQAVLQGESIPNIATRLASEVGDKNRKAAIRNARTMMTGVQNAGRVDSYKRAERMGIKLKQQWLATHDGRTRHSHRMVDYEVQPVGEKFSNGCRFPGDPDAPPSEVYNCRCTLRGLVDGLEPQARKYRDLSEIGDYEEWKKSKGKDTPKTDFTQNDKDAIAELRQKYGTLEGAMLQGTPEEITKFTELLAKERASTDQYDFETLFNNQQLSKSSLYRWQAAPTKAQNDAITTYARTGHVEMNQHLRFGNYAQPKTKEEIEELSNYLGSCETKENIYLKRGVSIPDVGRLFGESIKKDPESVIGNLFTDKGFTSTTPYESGGFGGNVIEYIYAPKGTHGAYIEKYVAAKNEQEFLIKDGQNFIIRNVIVETDKWNEKQYKVFLEVVNG